MYRSIITELRRWKLQENRKPLVLNGARQVGKTYILKSFGRSDFQNVVYVNCDRQHDVGNMFVDYDISRILRNISAITGEPITPGKTLVILDEIQEVPAALAALKYFCEEAPEYHIAVAGSLLGIALHDHSSFPVGKVNMLTLYPMTFDEFLLALDKQAYRDILCQKDWDSMQALRHSFVELLRQYYYVGGMPEAVLSYATTGDIWEVRRIQNEILAAYRNDISKHAPASQIARINMVWNGIPAQLARDNKKFIFGAVKKGARAKDYETAIQWLVDAGIVVVVNRVNKAVLPLKFYEDASAFKLFLHDCGLLGALAQTPPAEMLVGSRVFEEYKGAFTENYVLQQLRVLPETFLYYYTNGDSTMEIDFVVQYGASIVPIEVKAEENLRSKSLATFMKANPQMRALRLSMSGFRRQDWLINIPLFAAGISLEAVADEVGGFSGK